MKLPEQCPQRHEALPAVQLDRVLTDFERRRIVRESNSESQLRCVSSGYLSDGCSCEATAPAGVAAAAWARELERSVGDRFFHFAWRERVWLAYGLQSGRVRGVYCPSHSAERDGRASVQVQPASAPARPERLSAGHRRIALSA